MFEAALSQPLHRRHGLTGLCRCFGWEATKFIYSCNRERAAQLVPLLRSALMARLIFDLTTSCYWAGPPVGIVRVERQLARLAFQDATPIVFSVFNQATKRFGRLPTEVALAVIEGKAGLQLPKPAARPQRSLLASCYGNLERALLGYCANLERAWSRRNAG